MRKSLLIFIIAGALLLTGCQEASVARQLDDLSEIMEQIPNAGTYAQAHAAAQGDADADAYVRTGTYTNAHSRAESDPYTHAYTHAYTDTQP